MPSQDSVVMAIDAESYYQKAIEATQENAIDDAISYIDMSISLSTNKALYVFYKIKILYLNGLKEESAKLILSQFHYLYQNCSLKDFLKILDYYQYASQCSSLELADTLGKCRIPSVLAYEYISLLEDVDYNFHSKALEYKKSSNYQSCIACCQLALRFQQDSVSLLHLQADCYVSIEDFHSAICVYEQILALYPQTAEVAYPLGKAYMQINEPSKAISYFKQFLHTIPSHIEALSHLGDCYIKCKDYSNAITIFNTLIALESFTPGYYLKLGEIYSLMNRNRIAQKYYKQANQLQNNISPTHSFSLNKLPKPVKISALILLLTILQFCFFKTGIFPSIIYGVSVTVEHSTIPVNGYTDFQITYKQFPFYAKDPCYMVTSSNPKIATPIEGLDALNGLSVGTCTFDVVIYNKPKANFSIQVIEKNEQ